MRNVHLSSHFILSSHSFFSVLKIALLGAVFIICFPSSASAATLMDSYTFSTTTYPLINTVDCRGSADPLGHCPMAVVSPFWTAGSAYTLTSVASNLGFNLSSTLPVFQTTLGSTLIRFQLMKLTGFTRVSCYSEYKTVNEWLAFGIGYNENGRSYIPTEHNFDVGTYPHISFSGTECALTVGESYAVEPEDVWQPYAGTFAFGNFNAPAQPGGVGFTPKIYDVYGATTLPTSYGLSNVLFLPGLEASRLYVDRGVTCQINCEDQLWESNKKTDVEDLYLNADGTSKNAGIYTRDAIKETNTPFATGFAGQNIYKTFFATLDSLTDPVLPEHMARWESYAYDWRQSVDDIVNNGTQYQTGQKSLITTLENLVASSTTGKVTIIAHSNGGLLAKALMVKLQAMKTAGENNLIDQIDVLILVASPQIGTATAVPVLLHGYDQRIAGGLFLDEEHARELGRNMPGAYGLLPSKEYINRMSASPVAFSDNPIPSGITTSFISAYGNVVDSYPEYKSFLLGQEGRVDPATTETKLPIKLSDALLTKAETLHNSIDAWTPPGGLRVVEVAGWGLDTVASFEYYPKLTGCTGGSVGCASPYVLDQKPIFTVDGDKTVVEPSALYMEGEKYWVDFRNYNSLDKVNREHKDILEVDQLNNFIKSLISKTDIVFDTVLKNTQPVDTKNHLRISIHSPVSIGSYDSLGNFTGKVCKDTEDFCCIQEDIPNSSYLEFGEGKYLNMPEENMKKVVLQGTGTGTFTYISEKVSPQGQTITSIFTDIPVTTQTQGEVVLNTVTQVPELKLDVTGDGIIDFTLIPTPEFDPITFLQIMKATIDSFDIKPARKTILSKRIDGIIKSIQKGKIGKAQLKAERFQNVLKEKVAKPVPKNPKPQKLTNADAEILIGMLETLLNNLEK